MTEIKKIENDPPVAKDKLEITPQYRQLQKIFKPTKQDEYLYNNYGSFPLEEEGLKLSLPSSTQMIEQTFSGTVDFGRRVSSVLTPSLPGQCISQIYLKVEFRDSTLNADITDIIRTVEFEVGNQRIQRYTGSFLKSWLSLSGIPHRIGNLILLPFALNQYIPFPLHYLDPNRHQMRVNIEFTDSKDLKMKNATLLVEYEFPNPALQISKELHSTEYLLETVQTTGYECGLSQHSKLRLNFNGLVKTLMWSFLELDSKGNTRRPSKM